MFFVDNNKHIFLEVFLFFCIYEEDLLWNKEILNRIEWNFISCIVDYLPKKNWISKNGKFDPKLRKSIFMMYQQKYLLDILWIFSQIIFFSLETPYVENFIAAKKNHLSEPVYILYFTDHKLSIWLLSADSWSISFFQDHNHNDILKKVNKLVSFKNQKKIYLLFDI